MILTNFQDLTVGEPIVTGNGSLTNFSSKFKRFMEKGLTPEQVSVKFPKLPSKFMTFKLKFSKLQKTRYH